MIRSTGLSSSDSQQPIRDPQALSRLKIGMVCYPSYGGSGVVATELGIHLADLGHEIHFITYDKPFRLMAFHENIFFHEVDVSNYPVFKYPPYILALANKIYEVARRENLQILHAHYAVPHTMAVHMAAQMLGSQVRTVTTLHGTDVTIMSEDQSLRDVTEFSLNQMDALTAVSDDLKQYTLKTLNIARPIQKIYNFINASQYSRQQALCSRSRLKVPVEEKLLIHISNFRPVKRIQDVLEIFRGVNARCPSHLMLVGDGPEMRTAYDLTDRFGLRDRVHFMGKQDNVAALLSCSDLFLLPSEKESFGLAALEAMACEVPVIASRTGGIPEVVEDGICGALSEVGDTEKMIEDAVSILSDSVRYNEMASAARIRAISLFEEKTIASQYVALYERLLSEPRHTPASER
ncbi:N-acetyl-alpha-D-glucosaminyl L-malate synthase BshA [Acidaminobacter hydrogenoformans]|uniref:N-acetyl-alpha-D-glucosaminyl L-malate synthase BshA n=1 Tax=Acidaminobacter hydrogenoformans DSM 2784 TaxID=1120920 RepID=A0A1G5RTW2_9FIRM|nr:N-acetyl-alpha-D-glucosaminyl L-malate synthase BshA [Acidaminobacter hydrogenoformans]SCZ77552.1 N-acetyl-alpha-D-glucosaminyl L-malate synthase BshA [Acidaminobacter hydrogenoformans DSM 2784]